mmetsp:Transcript_6035/g.20784  ORF Transcript_6035/g.20784 Transcript_6035/m.20784 type:complete len:298 (+) Transcript_6035:3498-4391(+)
MGLCSDICKRELAHLLQDLYPFLDISQVQRVVELPHDVLSHLSNLHHFLQFVDVASNEVQERQPLKVLALLVRKLDYLKVSLPQGLHSEVVPCLLVIKLLSGLKSNLKVSTLNSELKFELLVLNKVKSNLWKALLLQVSDDGLSTKLGASDHLDDLVVLFLQQCKLEDVLCRVNLNLPSLSIPVEAVDSVCKNLGQVHRVVERLHNAIVAIRKAVFDVVERCVEEDTRVVPGSTFDPDALMYGVGLRELLIAYNHSMLAEEGHHGHLSVPDNVLDRGRAQLPDHSPLLHVKHHHFVL